MSHRLYKLYTDSMYRPTTYFYFSSLLSWINFLSPFWLFGFFLSPFWLWPVVAVIACLVCHPVQVLTAQSTYRRHRVAARNPIRENVAALNERHRCRRLRQCVLHQHAHRLPMSSQTAITILCRLSRLSYRLNNCPCISIRPTVFRKLHLHCSLWNISLPFSVFLSRMFVIVRL